MAYGIILVVSMCECAASTFDSNYSFDFSELDLLAVIVVSDVCSIAMSGVYGKARLCCVSEFYTTVVT